MIDWHAHILPGIDDGSKNVEESVKLLEMLSSQNIDTVIATPHFYADRQSLDDFLIKRNEAYEKLKPHILDNAPDILLGAEVAYYDGISRLEGFKKLRVENRKVLLLEMPMTKWSEYTVGEIEEISSMGNLTLVLAHVERCIKYQSMKTLERLYDCGVYMQLNASFFNRLGTRKRAVDMIMHGDAHFIGSDCHNTTTRPPQIGQAYEYLKKKLGSDGLKQFDSFGHSKLSIK